MSILRHVNLLIVSKTFKIYPTLTTPPSPPPQNNFQNYFQGVDSVFGCYTKQPSLG